MGRSCADGKLLFRVLLRRRSAKTLHWKSFPRLMTKIGLVVQTSKALWGLCVVEWRDNVRAAVKVETLRAHFTLLARFSTF